MAIPVFMGQLLLLSGSVILGLLLSRFLRLEMTLACLLAGIGTGLAIPFFGFDTGIRASNIQALVFYVILPVLIFEAAWHIKPGLLKRWLAPILLLSTFGLIITSSVLAALVYYGINSPSGFPWQAALLTGAILAATDPISVVSSLKRLQAPEDLTTLVEGESLFNDATALVLFGAILSVALNSNSDMDSSYVAVFAATFFGGIVVGGVMALIAAIIALILLNRASTNLVLIVLAFASFYIAEHVFHVSGIMSVVSAALLSRSLLKEHEQEFAQSIGITWEWLGLWLNALIFVLMGLVTSFDMFTEQWLAIIIAVVAAIIARTIAVFTCGAMTKPLVRPIPIGWQIILSWGGLRGAIAIALVLSLPVELPYWWTIQSMVFGVVLFSLLIQGPTTSFLIKRYGKPLS